MARSLEMGEAVDGLRVVHWAGQGTFLLTLALLYL